MEEKKSITPTKSPRDGVDYLKEIGIKEVSDKTFINKESLQALFDKDFEKLNRAKIFDFMQILEREFDVNLSELKSDYMRYYHNLTKAPVEKVSVQESVVEKTAVAKATNPTIKTEDDIAKTETKVTEPLLETETESVTLSDDKSKAWMKYLLLGLASLLGLYFLFFNSDTKEKVVVQDSDIKIAQNVEKVKEKSGESLLTHDATFDKTIDDKNDEDLDKMVKEMFKENSGDESASILKADDMKNAKVSTKNADAATKNEKAQMPTQNKRRISVSQPPEEETMTLLEDMQKKTNKNTAEALAAKTPVKTAPKKVAQSRKSRPVAKNVKRGLLIKPTKRAWVGVVYLDTMQKKEFLIASPLRLKEGVDQLIMVGQKDFKIYNKQREKKFLSKKKVRFLYKGGKLTELTKAQFDSYAGDNRW